MCVCELSVQSVQLHTHHIYRNKEHSSNVALSVFEVTSYINITILLSACH